MKSIMKTVLLCVALISTPAMAEKVAVLGVQEALLKSDAAQKFRNSLQQKFSADAKQLRQLEEQAKNAREKLQKNKDLASKEEVNKMRLQFQKAFAEFQKRAQVLQQKQAQEEQAFLKTMRPKLDKVILGLIEKQKYDVVIAKRATLFAAKRVDITAEVVELLNKAK